MEHLSLGKCFCCTCSVHYNARDYAGPTGEHRYDSLVLQAFCRLVRAASDVRGTHYLSLVQTIFVFCLGGCSFLSCCFRQLVGTKDTSRKEDSRKECPVFLLREKCLGMYACVCAPVGLPWMRETGTRAFPRLSAWRLLFLSVCQL